MQTAKIFMNGRSQAIRLPREFQFEGDDVFIQRHGDVVVLVPRSRVWAVFLNSLRGFSDDFMAQGRETEMPQPREPL